MRLTISLPLQDIRTMIDTNVIAVAAFMRAFTPGMIARNKYETAEMNMCWTELPLEMSLMT